MSKTLIVVFDTETTGLSFSDDHVVQLASAMYPEGEPEAACTFESLANPGKPIPSGAAMVHGISDEQVAHKPSSQEVASIWWRHVQDLAEEYSAKVVLAAHNSSFDVRMMAKYFGPEWPGVPVICTMRTARRLEPFAANHKLTTLVTHHHKLDDELHKKAHDALADVWMATMLLEFYLKRMGHSAEQMANWSSTPELLKVMPFGKHKGVPFDKLPPSSMRWLVNQPDMDPDVRYTALRYLNGQ